MKDDKPLSPEVCDILARADLERIASEPRLRAVVLEGKAFCLGPPHGDAHPGEVVYLPRRRARWLEYLGHVAILRDGDEVIYLDEKAS